MDQDEYFDCPYKEGHSVYLNISAKDVPYDGAQHPASLNNGFAGIVGDAVISAINYEGVDETEYDKSIVAPTEMGTYKATVTVTDIDSNEHVVETVYKITEPNYIFIPATGDKLIEIICLALIIAASGGYVLSRRFRKN